MRADAVVKTPEAVGADTRSGRPHHGHRAPPWPGGDGRRADVVATGANTEMGAIAQI